MKEFFLSIVLLQALILSNWILLNNLYKDKYNEELPAFINVCLKLIILPVVCIGAIMAFGV